ncbi:MAG: hypothetical protein KIT79_06520 [Deltaproteobacteria bacterium]|nr:hypothetical protein [Deltaproteobacteria bacterium]
MDNPINLGFFVLMLVPGYIFAQSKDIHLLRENVPQFEKTFEIILYSAMIWALAIMIPYFPFRENVVSSVTNATKNGTVDWTEVINDSTSYFYLVILVATFLLGNVWGYLRKKPLIDSLIKYFTGRDWYPSVAFRFFQENINRGVIVSMDGFKYFGVLFSAPDTKDDSFILLKDVYVVLISQPNQPPQKLTFVDSVLIRITDINEIQSVVPKAVIPPLPKSFWKILKEFFSSFCNEQHHR